jgi:hypothetical protein
MALVEPAFSPAPASNAVKSLSEDTGRPDKKRAPGASDIEKTIVTSQLRSLKQQKDWWTVRLMLHSLNGIERLHTCIMQEPQVQRRLSLAHVGTILVAFCLYAILTLLPQTAHKSHEGPCWHTVSAIVLLLCHLLYSGFMVCKHHQSECLRISLRCVAYLLWAGLSLNVLFSCMFRHRIYLNNIVLVIVEVLVDLHVWLLIVPLLIYLPAMVVSFIVEGLVRAALCRLDDSRMEEIVEEYVYVATGYEALQHPTACSICCCEFKEKELLCSLPCQKSHAFHHDCIATWLKQRKSCPICRTPVPTRTRTLASAPSTIPTNPQRSCRCSCPSF